MKTPRFWQSKNLSSSLLLPAALIYRLGAWTDRCFTKPQHAPLPVISVGNVTAGGAGKTPTTLALIPLLRELGYTPHILTRGYKGTKHTAHRVHPTDEATTVGDEAILLTQAAPTWVGRDRLASAKAAAAQGATILICDDALQHHRLCKDLSLLVVDGPFGIGNGLPLPAGPLREPVQSALQRCHAMIMIGEDAQQLAARFSLPTFQASLQPNCDPAFLKYARWFAFAGIGRPEKFYATLRAFGADVVGTHNFPDHHTYTDADIAYLCERAAELDARLITTEKDGENLAPMRLGIPVLPIRLVIEQPQQFADFLARSLSKHLAS